MSNGTVVRAMAYAQAPPFLRRARNVMGNMFIFSNDDNPSELALEVPDEAEEADLKRHATRCALRYRSLKLGLKSQGDRLKRIEIVILIVSIWMIATSQQFGDMLKALLGL